MIMVDIIMARLQCLLYLFATFGSLFGKSFHHGDFKITGGTSVDISEVPYMASVEFMGRFACPAVIIGPRWVATSATCMDLISPEDIIVRTGATQYEVAGHLWPVENIVTHSDYDAEDQYAADLSLVELSLDIIESNTTKIIPITTKEPSSGVNARVTGWGAVAEGSIMHRGLLSVELPIYERSQCQTHFGFDLTDLRLCTLKEGAGPCDNDDGDPLVVDGVLVGIKSWIPPEQCGNINRPSAYVNLANPSFTNFIKATTGI